LRPGGVFGMILPNKFMQARYGKGLRKLLSDAKAVWKVVNFEDAQVFEEATTYTCLLFLQKAPSPKVLYIPAGDYLKEHADRPNLTEVEPLAFPAEPKRLTAAPWVFVSKRESGLMDRLAAAGPTLGEIAERIFQALITGADPVFLFEGCTPLSGGLVRVYSESLNREVEIEQVLLKPVVRSGKIGRYWAQPTHFVLFPYKISKDKAELIPEGEMATRFPKAWAYCLENKGWLESREGGKFRGPGWYRLGRTQNLHMWEQPKIMVPYMVQRLAAYCDLDGNYYFVNVTTGGYGLILKDQRYSLLYVTGLLNSRLLDFFLRKVTTRFHGGYFAANKQYIEQLPIRRINFDNPEEKKIHDDLIALVERMLELNKRLKDAVGRERGELERKIERTDREIDELVYRLYGLTEEEIAVVEGHS